MTIIANCSTVMLPSPRPRTVPSYRANTPRCRGMRSPPERPSIHPAAGLGGFSTEGTIMDTGHGWRMFAAIVLGVAGVLRFFDAIWAFRYHGALPDDFEAALFGGSLATYGWVYLIVAIILVGCAFA